MTCHPVLACLLLSLGMVSTSQAEPSLDQQFDPTTTAHDVLAVMYRGGYFAQTLRVGLSGELAGVDLMLARKPVMQTDVLFEVSATVDGAPAPTLAPPSMAVIPWDTIPLEMDDWVHVDLSSLDIHVREGDVLALVVKLNTTGPVPVDPTRSQEIVWHGTSMDPYAGGAPFAHPALPGAAWIPLGESGTSPDLGFRTWVDAVREVAIDFMPGSLSNMVSPRSQGRAPVAVFSALDFDATEIDPSTIEVSGAQVGWLPNDRPMTSTQDVNEDGLDDLVILVSVADLDLAEMVAEAEVVLTATTYDGAAIRGTDWVRIVRGGVSTLQQRR